MSELKIYKYSFIGGYNVAIISKSRKEADKIYEPHYLMDLDNKEDKLILAKVSEHNIEQGVIISPDEYCLDIEKH